MAGTKAEPEVRRISIATVKSRSEADTISRRLKAAGIECFIVHERGGATPVFDRKHLAAIKVQVRSVDVRRAIQELQTKPGGTTEILIESPAQADDTVLPRTPNSTWVFVAAGIISLVAAGLALLLFL